MHCYVLQHVPFLLLLVVSCIDKETRRSEGNPARERGNSHAHLGMWQAPSFGRHLHVKCHVSRPIDTSNRRPRRRVRS
jgi:hypothetical protein